jgi:ceramide glucosyltransferase
MKWTVSFAALAMSLLFFVVARSPALLEGIGALILFNVVLWHWQQASAIAARGVVAGDVSAAVTRFPSITVIRPVRGRDVDAEQNFAAALDHDYPGPVETLFVFDDDKDPALPVALKAVADHAGGARRDHAAVLIAGAPPRGRTGKLNAMAYGMRVARGELVAFGDSDTRPDRHVLRKTVEALLGSKTAGAAFAPVLVDRPPRAAGDVLYALMQNALYGPLAEWAAGERRELPFIMGQLMVFRREALRAIGGVECAEGQLVDDMYIGKRVFEAGYRNVIGRHPLYITAQGMRFGEFIPVFRRWMMFGRNGLPLSFTWRQWVVNFEYWIAVLACVAAIVSGHPVGALVPAAALVAIGVSLLGLHRRIGGAKVPLRLAWAAWALLTIAPLVMLLNELDRRVDWRGRRYVVDSNAELAPTPAVEGAEPAPHPILATPVDTPRSPKHA